MSDVQLYLGDCLSILPTLAAGSVDAVVTDPPYGIDFDYGDKYQDNPLTYGDFIKQCSNEFTRLSDGYVFVFQGMPNADKWSMWFPAGYRIFAALKNFTQFRPTDIQYSFDPVIFWKANGKKLEPVAGMRDYHIGNTARWICEPSNGHPCPRPIDTMRYLVELCTKQGDTILDPFMGSGTTGVACVQTGRNFIGIEIDPTYYAIAEKRIAQAQLQIRMEI